MLIDFALSIQPDGRGDAGLFSGFLQIEADGTVSTQLVWPKAGEGRALAACWRTPSADVAGHVSDYIARLMTPGSTIRLVEIRREG
jgi:hypothetical protein